MKQQENKSAKLNSKRDRRLGKTKQLLKQKRRLNLKKQLKHLTRKQRMNLIQLSTLKTERNGFSLKEIRI